MKKSVGTIGQRALKACQDYEYWQYQIRRLGNEIGGNLSLCLVDDISGRRTHLSQVYEGYIEVDPFSGPERIYYDPDEVVKRLTESGCKYCLAAHYLIQERKRARQKFGAAKRWIVQLGKTRPEL